MLAWSVTQELCAVLKDTPTPVEVPAELVATSSKRYVVLGLSPVTTVDTFVGLVPEPALVEEVDEPNEVDVP